MVAYGLRFGSAAVTLQSSGAHVYFPALAKSGIGIAALALIAGLLLVGVARIASGRRIEIESAPSYVRLLAGLFTLQLALYSVQETLEAQLGGAAFGSASDLLLWGAIGQLPVAAVAALALRWLFASLRPALGVISLWSAPADLAADFVLVQVPLAVRREQPAPVAAVAAAPLSRRGPPLSVR